MASEILLFTHCLIHDVDGDVVIDDWHVVDCKYQVSCAYAGEPHLVAT